MKYFLSTNLGTGSVNKSTGMLYDWVNFNLIVPFWLSYFIWWTFKLICLFRSETWGFVANDMTDVLSVTSSVPDMCASLLIGRFSLNLVKRHLRLMICFENWKTPTYCASAELSVTNVWRLLVRYTGAPLLLIKVPVVESLLSWNPDKISYGIPSPTHTGQRCWPIRSAAAMECAFVFP